MVERNQHFLPIPHIQKKRLLFSIPMKKVRFVPEQRRRFICRCLNDTKARERYPDAFGHFSRHWRMKENDASCSPTWNDFLSRSYDFSVNDVLGKTAKETNAIVNFYVYRCISQSFCQPSVDDVLKKNRAKGRDFSKNFENLVYVIWKIRK